MDEATKPPQSDSSAPSGRVHPFCSPFVWVIEAQFYHEGSDIVGAFATESAAEAEKTRLLKRAGKWQDACRKKNDWSGKAPQYSQADHFAIHKLRVKAND